MTTIPSIKLANNKGQIFLIGNDGFLDNPISNNDFNVRVNLGKWAEYSAARIDKNGTHIAVEDGDATFNLTKDPANIWIAANFAAKDIIVHSGKDSAAPSLTISERELQNPAPNTLEVSVDDMSDTTITFNVTKLGEKKAFGSGNGEIEGNMKVTKTFANAAERDAWLNANPPHPIIGPVSVVSNDPSLTPPDNIISSGTEPAITTADLNKSVKLFKDGKDADDNKLVVAEPASLQKYKDMVASGQYKPNYDKAPSYSGNIENPAYVQSVMSGSLVTAEAATTNLTPPTHEAIVQEEANRAIILAFANGRTYKHADGKTSLADGSDSKFTREELRASIVELEGRLGPDYKARLDEMRKEIEKPGLFSPDASQKFADLITTARNLPATQLTQSDPSKSPLLQGVMKGEWFVTSDDKHEPIKNDEIKNEFQAHLLKFAQVRFSQRTNGVPSYMEQDLTDGVNGPTTSKVFHKMFENNPELIKAYEKGGPAIFFKGGEYEGKLETLAAAAIKDAKPLPKIAKAQHPVRSEESEVRNDSQQSEYETDMNGNKVRRETPASKGFDFGSTPAPKATLGFNFDAAPKSPVDAQGNLVDKDGNYVAGPNPQNAEEANKIKLRSTEEQAAYRAGVQAGRNMDSQGTKADVTAATKSDADKSEGYSTLLTNDFLKTIGKTGSLNTESPIAEEKTALNDAPKVVADQSNVFKIENEAKKDPMELTAKRTGVKVESNAVRVGG